MDDAAVMPTDRQRAVQEGANALHADWEPEEPLCDGRCHNDAETVIDALYQAGMVVIKDDPDHWVCFTEDRWTVQHSVACRLSGDMPNCPYHKAIDEIADTMRDDLGWYRITGIDSEGLPSLELEGPDE